MTEIPHPCPPGVMSSSASLFPALHPELANVFYLQKFPITARAVFVEETSAAAVAKSLQLCLTLCDPIDGSPTGSPIPGIL